MHTPGETENSHVAPLILASASPRRQELLARVGIPLEVFASSVLETGLEPGEMPGAVAVRNARLKVADIVPRVIPGRLVLGADTIVVIDGEVLGKPSSAAEAASMLRRLSGRTHLVMTGFVLYRAPYMEDGLEQCVLTAVEFKPLSDREIDGYIATGEPFDKAGAYGIQGVGAFLVRRIDGSYTNVVGLPLTEVLEALARMGGPTPFAR